MEDAFHTSAEDLHQQEDVFHALRIKFKRVTSMQEDKELLCLLYLAQSHKKEKDGDHFMVLSDKYSLVYFLQVLLFVFTN